MDLAHVLLAPLFLLPQPHRCPLAFVRTPPSLTTPLVATVSTAATFNTV